VNWPISAVSSAENCFPSLSRFLIYKLRT
jgi:hypothetical protein